MDAMVKVRQPFSLLAAALATLVVLVFPGVGTLARAGSLPSGEVRLGQSLIEPAYNDANGSLIYLITPSNPPVNIPPPNVQHGGSPNVAPLYVIMYPTSAAGAIGTVNCAHQPMDNCPDHGPGLAGLAESVVPSVYGAGVWGHDHILAAPGSGGDFNVLWEPIAVLFTNSAAANTHITTLAQLQAAEAAGNAFEIPLPQATFHCSVNPAAPYNNGTPVPPV
jgi:hypothetical protein